LSEDRVSGERGRELVGEQPDWRRAPEEHRRLNTVPIRVARMLVASGKRANGAVIQESSGPADGGSPFVMPMPGDGLKILGLRGVPRIWADRIARLDTLTVTILVFALVVGFTVVLAIA